MLRQGRLQIVLLSTLGIALIASVGINLRQSRRLAADQRQRDADLQSLRQLRESLRQPGAKEIPAGTGEQNPGGEYQAALARHEATIVRLDRELSEAQANATDLQAELLNSNDEHEKAMASASERHRKEQEDLQSQLDTMKQELDSAQAESQASRQRTSALEADNAKLRNASIGGSASAPDFGRVVAGLQELNRRREAYLTSIMRRYRDITSQFRAMSGMLDSSRDPNSGAFSGPALTRIQDAVSFADDDFRQLNELNAQARELEKKLAKK